MDSHRLALTMLAAVLAVSGCTTFRQHNTHYRPVSQAYPAPLLHVNQKLQGQHARIILTDGSSIEAFDVRIEPDSTSWLASTIDNVKRIATERVRLVETRRINYGPLPGFVLGATATATGLGLWFEGQEGYHVPVLAIALVVGTLGGGVLGAWLGGKVGRRRPELVYQAPLEAYLQEAR